MMNMNHLWQRNFLLLSRWSNLVCVHARKQAAILYVVIARRKVGVFRYVPMFELFKHWIWWAWIRIRNHNIKFMCLWWRTHSCWIQNETLLIKGFFYRSFYWVTCVCSFCFVSKNEATLFHQMITNLVCKL